MSEVRKIEAEVEHSGNSFNIILVEQNQAQAIGLIAVAVVLNGGLGNGTDLESIREMFAEAMEADKTNRKNFLDAVKSLRR